MNNIVQELQPSMQVVMHLLAQRPAQGNNPCEPDTISMGIPVIQKICIPIRIRNAKICQSKQTKIVLDVCTKRTPVDTLCSYAGRAAAPPKKTGSSRFKTRLAFNSYQGDGRFKPGARGRRVAGRKAETWLTLINTDVSHSKC